MKKKRHKNIGNKNPELKENGMELEFGSDENFAFIAGFTSNGGPFGITYEEMRELEKEEKSSNKNDNIDLPF